MHQITLISAAAGGQHARLAAMKPSTRLTSRIDSARRWWLNSVSQRRSTFRSPLLFILLVALLLLGMGYGLGFSVGQGQGEQATQALQAEAEAERDALVEQHQGELAALRESRDAVRAEVRDIADRVREQVETAQLSAGSLGDLQNDIAALRQRYAALDDRYQVQADDLADAESEIRDLRTRLNQQQQAHDSERARLRAALLQAGLDGELAGTHGIRFEQQLAHFEQQLAVEREALTTLQRQWQDLSETLITELTEGTTLLSLDEVALFDSGATQLSAEGEQRVREVAELLQALPDYGITVEGHTDALPLVQSATADIRDNWGLSAIRAAATVAALEAAGIDPERLRAVGYASTRPLTSDPREAANRRVELMLYPPIEQRVLRLRQSQGTRLLPDATELPQDSAETPD